MRRKNLFFAGLSMLIILLGIILLYPTYSQPSYVSENQDDAGSDSIYDVRIFDKDSEETFLKQMLSDLGSVRVVFRFPPNTCACLELDFAAAVNRVSERIGGNNVFVVIAAETPRDVFFFRERTKLSCPVYGTSGILSASFDAAQTPYACLVSPDMIAHTMVTIDADGIARLIAYAKEAVY